MAEQKLLDILKAAVAKDASDVHLCWDKKPIFRIHGEMVTSDFPVLSKEDVQAVIGALLTDKQKTSLEKDRELDFSYAGLTDYQCRFNVYFEKTGLAAVVRIAPTKIENILRFDLPPVMQRLASKRAGLVVVAGTAGSGKSTTLTYMVDLINEAKKAKIITIEDPIEYVHESKKSLVVQREVGSDTLTFANALKYALRQDPDVVVVGEMRDFESMSMALTTAETGHLVITTVHAADAIETINRIIDVYPIGYKDQICAQLAGNLLGIIAQTLVPREGTSERVLATEVMLTTTSIRNLIRRGAFNEIRGQLDSEEDEDCHSLEKSLSRLVKEHVISVETAQNYAKHPNLLNFTEATDFKKEKSIEAKQVVKAESQSVQVKAEKVLIIDLHEDERANMKTALEQNGFGSVVIGENGEDGWEKVQLEKPDVVILDTQLYDIYAYDLCKKIKDFTAGACKVIMVTSNLKPSDMQNSKDAGADGFVIKTKAFELLLKALNNIINTAITGE